MKNQILLAASIILFVVSNVSAQTTAPPKQIAMGVVNGKAVTLPKPEYPAAAKAVGAGGAVNVQVTIDEEGNVFSASAVSGHPLLRQAAEQAARASKFKPTTLSGQPVKVTGVIVYNFVAPKSEVSNEKKLEIMGLAVYLTISDFMPSSEWITVGQQDSREITQLAAELAPLASVTKATGREKRAEIVKKVSLSLEKKLTGADAWQFQFGKAFGGLMIEFYKAARDADKNLDETAAKINLLIMRDLMFTAPAGTPPDVLDKFRELNKFADEPDLNRLETKARFAESLLGTLKTIKPDSQQ